MVYVPFNATLKRKNNCVLLKFADATLPSRVHQEQIQIYTQT